MQQEALKKKITKMVQSVQAKHKKTKTDAAKNKSEGKPGRR